MIPKNLLESPVFSCLWLAGIILVGAAAAEDVGPQHPQSPSIVPQGQFHAKSPDNLAKQPVEYASIGGTQIARLIARHQKAEQKATSSTDAHSPTSPTLVQPAGALFAPLATVTLAGASRSESIEGQQLRVPLDEAMPTLAQAGTWHDISGYRSTPGARHSQCPVWYNPLYFEDPNMERCGVSDGCLTDFVSATRFFGRTALLPYMIGSNEPHSCVRSLGDCPSCHQFGRDAYIAPLNAKGVALQTACTIGLVFLIP